jgi:hypothetical protein
MLLLDQTNHYTTHHSIAMEEDDDDNEDFAVDIDSDEVLPSYRPSLLPSVTS